MKKALPVGGELDADESAVLVSDVAPFRIISHFAVAFGSKYAEFTIEVDGVGTLMLDLFRPPDRPAFVAPRSVRSKYSGTYERTFRLDENLSAAILAAVEAWGERL